MPKQIGDYNKNQLLSVLRESGATSRVELSRLLDISAPAITRNTARLIENGIVRECGAEESSIGRKPTLIELCDDFCYVIGVDIVGDTLKVALANFMGTTILDFEEPACRQDGADAVLKQLIDSLNKIISDSKVPKEKIWVITIGTPGIFDSETGKSRLTFFLKDWDEIDIRLRVFEALGIETIIENDVNLDVIGESWKSFDKEYESLFYVKLGQGFASKIVLQNKLLRGWNRLAGEIGYMLPSVPEGAVDAENYENQMCNDAVSKRYYEMNGKNEIKTISDLCEFIAEGDDIAEKVMNELLNRFAIALLNSVVVVDPQVIILGGDACNFGEKEIGFLKQRMEQYFPSTYNIITSKLSKKSCLYGAIKTGLDYVEDRITNIW